MDKDYLQALRYKLQKRVRKLNSTQNRGMYHVMLKQFFEFLCDHKLLSGIVDELALLSDNDNITKEVEKICSERNYETSLEREKDYSAMCYKILKQCAESTNNFDPIKIGHNIAQGKSDTAEDLGLFNECFLEPFYEYIDESIDETGAILSLLRKYKERCEWFKKESLYSTWKDATQKGERLLAYDLYEYLHDQGIEFFIEPQSASGEVDMISSQPGQNKLLVDAKIFNPEKDKGKRYIISGFNQVNTYTKDFNQPIGYLVIFKTCENDLKFSLTSGISSVPFITHNNKTIFFITIDIFPYNHSASKRGTLKAVEISAGDLVEPQED